MSTPPGRPASQEVGIETPAFPGRRRQRDGTGHTARIDTGILAVWATPRSRSTAMLQSPQERGDMRAYFEPFSRSFYASEDRQSPRFADLSPRPEYNYVNMLAQLPRRARGAGRWTPGTASAFGMPSRCGRRTPRFP